MDNAKLKLKLKKEDNVVVIAGKAKGKTGKIIKIDIQKFRAFIGGLNIVKKHTKPNKKNDQGGIFKKEASIHLSNIMLYCDKCNKGVKSKIEIDSKGNKNRKCKICGTRL